MKQSYIVSRESNLNREVVNITKNYLSSVTKITSVIKGNIV